MTGENAFLIWFWLGLALIWVLPGIVVMQSITPRRLLERYFREPHFNFGETVIYSQFPWSLLRTLVFMASCISPWHRRGRQLDDYLEQVPRWYVRASAVYLVLLYLHFILVMGGMGVLLLWPE